MAVRQEQKKFSFADKYPTEHGGKLNKGKRKTQRPLATKRAVHLVLKSSEDNPLNNGKRCTLLNPTNHTLHKIIYEQAIKYGVKAYKMTFNHTHAHFAIKVPSRKAYNAFIRTVTARIVKYLSKITDRNLAGLFDLLPYTRVLNPGENPMTLWDYIDDNAQEALGMKNRKKEKKETAEKKKKEDRKNKALTIRAAPG